LRIAGGRGAGMEKDGGVTSGEAAGTSAAGVGGDCALHKVAPVQAMVASKLPSERRQTGTMSPLKLISAGREQVAVPCNSARPLLGSTVPSRATVIFWATPTIQVCQREAGGGASTWPTIAPTCPGRRRSSAGGLIPPRSNPPILDRRTRSWENVSRIAGLPFPLRSRKAAFAADRNFSNLGLVESAP
jgi:hypothetical protein